VYVVEAIITAVAENSLDIMTATNVVFSLFNAVPQNGDEEQGHAETSDRRVKAKADRAGADQDAGASHLFGDKL
jgi:hypothetical protein